MVAVPKKLVPERLVTDRVVLTSPLFGVTEDRVMVDPALLMVKPLNVANCPSGLVTMTVQTPAGSPVIGNWHEIDVVPGTDTDVAVIFVWPDCARTTEGDVEKPVPVI